jgi:hypothetical protein
MEVRNLIYTIRNVQVMLDSDLAALFEVETKAFNQAVKRNIDRFPDAFRFQITKDEYDILRSQIVTSSSDGTNTQLQIPANTDIRSQNVTLNKDKEHSQNKVIDLDSIRSQIVTLKQGQHRKYLPYVFTEQGVAMLTGLLRSDVATQMSIRIMTAFVEMRKFISENALIFKRLDTIEHRQISYKKEADDMFEQLFNAMEGKEEDIKENIFFEGQIYDAYSFIIQLIEKAKKEIILIDNYVDNSVLDMLSKKKKAVKVKIITHYKTKVLATDVKKFNQQYPELFVEYSDKWHDRFLLIDHNELYHIGASLKDLGKKCFAFSRIENTAFIPSLLGNI